MKNHTKKQINLLVRACDRFWRRIIILRANGRCEICGATEAKKKGDVFWIQAAHIITRGFWRTRWHPKNGVGACLDCHDDSIIMAWLERTDKRRYNWVIKQKQKRDDRRDMDMKKICENLEALADKALYQVA